MPGLDNEVTNQTRIKNLDSLLQTHIEANKKIVNVEETNFLGKGENYGSIIFRVDITVKDDKTGEEEVIHGIAKMLPESEILRKMFDVGTTVRKEIGFYNKIVPTFMDFLKELGVNEGVNMFPILYGGRLNLNDSNTVDDDSVILLENLIASGYRNIDRFVGFDYETIKLILKDLAMFHAVPMAFKMKKPEVFEKEIKPLCFFKFPTPPEPSPDAVPFHIPLLELIYQSDKCLPYAKVFEKKFSEPPKDYNMPPPNEPWGTLVHGDLWVNNLMIKLENGKPVANKFVDFQVYNYNHLFHDVLFLIFSSVQQNVLEEHSDELIRYYHQHFISTLEKLGCDTRPFELKLFLDELDAIAKREFMHILFFMFVIFGKQDPADSTEPFTNMWHTIKHLELKGKEKFWFIIQHFGKRGWI